MIPFSLDSGLCRTDENNLNIGYQIPNNPMNKNIRRKEK